MREKNIIIIASPPPLQNCLKLPLNLIKICLIKDTELVEDEVSKPDEAETAEVDEDPAAGTTKILLVPCEIQCVFFISTKVFVHLTNLKLFYRDL